MLTVNGQKMSKSLGNSILPNQLFSGQHELLDKPYSPMSLRFAMLQAHYRSTMDISNDALTAASKAYKKLMNGLRIARELTYDESLTVDKNEKAIKQINSIADSIYRGLNDDLNTAVAIAGLFNMQKKLNTIQLGQLQTEALDKATFDRMKKVFIEIPRDVLGLLEEKPDNFEYALDLILEDYKAAKSIKDYNKVDHIRAKLKQMGLSVKDMKHKIEWAYEE